MQVIFLQLPPKKLSTDKKSTLQPFPHKKSSAFFAVSFREGEIYEVSSFPSSPWMDHSNVVTLVDLGISVHVHPILLEPKWGLLFWLEFRPCFGGLTFKNRGHWGSRLIVHQLTYPVFI